MPLTDRYLRLNRWTLEIERRQTIEEGRDFEQIEAEFDSVLAKISEGVDVADEAGALFDRLEALPVRDDYQFVEPGSLSEIRDARPAGPRTFDIDLVEDQLKDRLHAAWQGRCAGCLLGKPTETVPASRIWELLDEIDAYPLADYLPADLTDEQQETAGLDAIPSHNRTYADAVDRMPRDDDIDYTILGLAMLRSHGRGFGSNDVARTWLSSLPAFQTFTAERVAYRNFLTGIEPPASARYRNPFREWIGAQIRADIYGYVSPGQPAQAAEFAWRDARISHVKNGIYGAMWVAAMLAAAPATNELHELVEIGLSEIPAASRLSEAVETVLEWYADGVGWLEAVDRLHDRWDDDQHHHWLHTISNAQVVALGVLWSEAEFGTAITRAVHAGFDTDCNGATVGSVMGMFLGTDAIDARWTDPLADAVDTSLTTRPRARISALAEDTWGLHQAIQTDSMGHP